MGSEGRLLSRSSSPTTTPTHVHGVVGHAVLLGHHLEHGLHHIRDDDGGNAGHAGQGVEVHLSDAPGTDDP